MNIEQLKFPIGEFQCPENISPEQVEAWIADIAAFPAQIRELTANLSVTEKNWSYRPGGWSIKQVVHHCADSHMNSIIRFKLALTEEQPTIRPYFEDRWANLADDLDDNLEDSLRLLQGLHSKLAKLLRSLSPSDLKRSFVHPEHGKVFFLDENIGVYAWHGKHHLAHIRQALAAKGEYYLKY
jgi:hypothetical protein